ncbi:hypothetical protein WR25_19438 isoform F [Diploscapter pachys]|uniref:Gamma-glutamyltransferase n=1 Tax=Diploscapter pachys TaxID=2018661 RepID=A0A2A2JWP4_9BILA|nr:hypothetical protein WR25_19438 isoform C [Diploscapter pachys]PAV66002.1 hypothetical protein WR25_19438 isoform F [Diploscapter pachys]
MAMVRIGEESPPRRGSPSEVFSRDINHLHQTKKEKRDGTCARTLAIVFGILTAIFLLATIALAIVVGIKYSQDNNDNNDVTERIPNVIAPTRQQDSSNRPQFQWPLPSGSLYAHYKKAAVASDHGLCSEIGRDIMIQGGNAIDSVIATLLCVGVVNPQSSGIGGGFLMTLYNKTTGLCHAINARETAPAAANETMFVKNKNDSSVGYKSIAVPSEINGYWTIYRRFGSGKVPWSKLFEASIRLCNEGFPVSSNLATVLADKEKDIQAEPTMKDIFVNPATNRVYEEGDIMKRTTLGTTYQLLANATDPIELFYKGGMAQSIAGEISDNGGIITEKDLADYETVVDDAPLISTLLPGDLEMCGPPPPSSFVVTQSLIVTMGELYKSGNVDFQNPKLYHDLIEMQKFAYAQRTKLGDLKFVESARALVAQMLTKEYTQNITKLLKDTAQKLEYYGGDMKANPPDHGTSHVSIIDAEGNAVSVTSTINQLLGSMRASPTLGIVWNDEMVQWLANFLRVFAKINFQDDFSTPGQSNGFGFAPSETNFIVPGKRPMSSMSPLVVYNKNENKAEMVVGASGGSFIISAIAQTVIRTLFFNQTVKVSLSF